VSNLIQKIYVNDLLFYDQYHTSVKILHVESFPTIHFFSPLLHGFNNSGVSSAVPYLCLLFSICNAYAEIGLLVLMYHVFSLCLITIDLADCPTYELLQVLHLSLHIPLEFALVLTILSVSCRCIVFVARRAIFKFVFEEISYFSC